jgi:hypothetical protein
MISVLLVQARRTNTLLIKTNLPGFYKDTNTGAIINKNTSELQTIKAKIRKSKEQTALAERVGKIEGDLSEIKAMLKLLVNSK